MSVLMTVYNCDTQTALNSSDNLPSYPPDNHHNSDDVYWMGREGLSMGAIMWPLSLYEQR